MIDRLANGDITKHDEIYKLNYISCLTQLAWWTERDRYIDEVNKARERAQKK
jgi:hypothetical protein